ncbi:hypothetical protein NDU88_010618 [Pleurodeles waltl]|uniref:FXYD domain-containing ion transport regulator n=1 Tax=Pleurodeles waltl TaxID=8319 RepID=A0AAV7PYF8_PLEWA|nr:hypothetical protein NDU88_010618 [Pleurodeles waltl]
MCTKMFLTWLLLAQFISLVGANALSTPVGTLLPGTEENADLHTTREPPSTEPATLMTLHERTDQTSSVIESSDQHNSSSNVSTAAPASLIPTEVTPGKPEPTTFETISTIAEEKGPTPYRSAESTGAGRASKDDGVDQKKQDSVFYYDYTTLRVHGLICALVFFVTGILIITCGRCRCAPCCHKKKKSRVHDEMTRL